MPELTIRTISTDAKRSHDLGGELDLALGRRAVAGPALGRLDDRGDHVGVGVAEDQRAPGADPVDVAVAVDVDQLEALAALDEDRVVAADRAASPAPAS